MTAPPVIASKPANNPRKILVELFMRLFRLH